MPLLTDEFGNDITTPAPQIADEDETAPGTVAALTDPGPQQVKPLKPLECVPYARERSGLDIHGNAYQWWDRAVGHYVTVNRPIESAVMVFAASKKVRLGHVAVVTRIVSPTEIRVDHANWTRGGNIELNVPVIDISPKHDWSEVRVWNSQTQKMGTTNYAIRGFITQDRIDIAIAK